MRLTILLLIALLPPRQDDLTDSKFKRLQKELRPAKGEKWLSVPWKVDLLEARAKAVKEKKPLFLWGMNGHPLGCT